MPAGSVDWGVNPASKGLVKPSVDGARCVFLNQKNGRPCDFFTFLGFYFL